MSNVMKCKGKCKDHEYQDKTYGKGMRVHTRAVTPTQVKTRCTVCGHEEASAKGAAKK